MIFLIRTYSALCFFFIAFSSDLLALDVTINNISMSDGNQPSTSTTYQPDVATLTADVCFSDKRKSFKEGDIYPLLNQVIKQATEQELSPEKKIDCIEYSIMLDSTDICLAKGIIFPQKNEPCFQFFTRNSLFAGCLNDIHANTHVRLTTHYYENISSSFLIKRPTKNNTSWLGFLANRFKTPKKPENQVTENSPFQINVYNIPLKLHDNNRIALYFYHNKSEPCFLLPHQERYLVWGNIVVDCVSSSDFIQSKKGCFTFIQPADQVTFQAASSATFTSTMPCLNDTASDRTCYQLFIMDRLKQLTLEKLGGTKLRGSANWLLSTVWNAGQYAATASILAISYYHPREENCTTFSNRGRIPTGIPYQVDIVSGKKHRLDFTKEQPLLYDDSQSFDIKGNIDLMIDNKHLLIESFGELNGQHKLNVGEFKVFISNNDKELIINIASHSSNLRAGNTHVSGATLLSDSFGETYASISYHQHQQQFPLFSLMRRKLFLNCRPDLA